MKKKIYQVDAFTNESFSGNAAGVMPDATGLDDNQMLAIAKAMRLSETAFVFPGSDDYDFQVRFFTPTDEVDLCGHATIATFHLLKQLGIVEKEKKEVVQKTKAGILKIKYLEDDTVLMEQAKPEKIDINIDEKELSAIMGIDMDTLGLDNVLSKSEVWSTGLKDIIVPVKSVDALKSIDPNMEELSKYSERLDVIGAHAFTIDDEKKIWTRNFAPVCGIPEESATGTSNGALGACLYSNDYSNKEDLTFTSHQGYWMDSPSQIHVEVKHEDGLQVWVGGKAAITINGEIVIPNR